MGQCPNPRSSRAAATSPAKTTSNNCGELARDGLLRRLLPRQPKNDLPPAPESKPATKTQPECRNPKRTQILQETLNQNGRIQDQRARDRRKWPKRTSARGWHGTKDHLMAPPDPPGPTENAV